MAFDDQQMNKLSLDLNVLHFTSLAVLNAIEKSSVDDSISTINDSIRTALPSTQGSWQIRDWSTKLSPGANK